jgi:transposase
MELAELQAQNAALTAEVEKLKQELATALALVQDLQDRLSKNSTNSGKPPSSDPPDVVRKSKPPTGRKPGGQPGHKGHKRALVPAERVDVVVECRPPRCGRCATPLAGEDPAPFCHQRVELPELRPHVTEYRLHKLACPACRAQTRADLPAGVVRRL